MKDGVGKARGLFCSLTAGGGLAADEVWGAADLPPRSDDANNQSQHCEPYRVQGLGFRHSLNPTPYTLQNTPQTFQPTSRSFLPP